MRDLSGSRPTRAFRCRRLVLLAVAGLFATAASGCAGVVRSAPSTRPAKATQPARRALPSWAPEHPSKEFLRAAQVFRPVAEEAQAYSSLYLPAWELFGSLTDQQVKEFLTRRQMSEPIAGMEKSYMDDLKEREHAKQIGGNLVYYWQKIAVKVSSFSPRQRAIFASLRKACQEPNRGKPGEDLLVTLYKMGAKKDLSNVEISFDVFGGHAVFLMIRPTVGGWCMADWVAQL